MERIKIALIGIGGFGNQYVNTLLTDEEREKCDKDAFNPDKQGQNVFAYYEDIKILKNQRIIDNLLNGREVKNKILVCDDLGIYAPAWEERGFIYLFCVFLFSSSKFV